MDTLVEYYFRYPDHDQLQSVYAAYLQPILHRQLDRHPVWSSPSKISALAGSMIQIYEEIRQKFTVDDFSHYMFTPRDLTRWVMGLLRYDLMAAQNNSSSDHILEILAHEAHRLFRDRIVGQDSLNKFDNILMSVIRSDWGANIFDALDGECYH